MMAPFVDEIAEERDEVVVGKVNVDENPELATKFGIFSIPTLVVMEGGKVLEQAAGARPKDAILDMLDG